MSYKSIVVALLGLSLTGCAVYGGGGYGHRGYDRGYTTVYYRTQPYPVYVVPRYERHDNHYRQHYYVRAPLPPRYQSPRHSDRHDYRIAQPQARWDDRRGRVDDRRHQQHSQGRYDDRRRGWEQRN
nr:hypothetical protein [uncultured Pseudomonas sp.]